MSSEKSPSQETRRDFLIKGAICAIGAIFLGNGCIKDNRKTINSILNHSGYQNPKEAGGQNESDKDKRREIVSILEKPKYPNLACKEAGSQNNGSELDKACRADIDDPERQIRLIEGLRSEQAFAEMADKLAKTINPEKRKMTFLYPGAGGHIAPLLMAARLIKTNKIDEAGFTFTDIDRCRLKDFEENLKSLEKIDPDFKFEGGSSRELGCGDKGTRNSYLITYLGKPITIIYQLACGDKDLWFRNKDFKSSDICIQHDSVSLGIGSEITCETLKITKQFIDAQRNNAKNSPTVIMEDTTNFNGNGNSSRKFDLELFGTLDRGSRAYGHRDLKEFKLPRRVNKDICKKDIRGMMMSAETDKPAWNNSVLLKFHPQIFSLGAYTIDFMIHVSNKWDGMEIWQMVEHSPKILVTLNQINPKLAEAFALRLLQAIKNNTAYISDEIAENYKNPSEGYREIIDLLETISLYSSDNLEKHIGLIRDYIKNLSKNHALWLEIRAAKNKYNEALEKGYYKSLENKPKLKKAKKIYDSLLNKWKKEIEKPYKEALSNTYKYLGAQAEQLFNAISNK